MSERKIRVDCKRMAPCGKTSMSRCRKMKDELPECKECSFVRKLSRLWKMENRKPMKKCCRCGRWLQLSAYYERSVIINGKRYEGYHSGACKMCVSDRRHEKIIKINQMNLNFK